MHLWRPQLVGRIRHRAPPPRRHADGHWRRHQQDPAPGDREAVDRAAPHLRRTSGALPLSSATPRRTGRLHGLVTHAIGRAPLPAQHWRAESKKSGAWLGLVNPPCQQTCGRHGTMLVTLGMRLPHEGAQALVVVTRLGLHAQWLNEVGGVVGKALQPCDVARRAQGRSARFSHTLAIAPATAKIWRACSSSSRRWSRTTVPTCASGSSWS